MSFIRTLTGDVAPTELGVTYAHDHLYCMPPLWKEKRDIDLLIDEVEATIKDVELFKAAGGQAIYDATAIDYGRDPVTLKTISERTGIRIIATAGFNKPMLWPAKIPRQNITFRDWIASASR